MTIFNALYHPPRSLILAAILALALTSVGCSDAPEQDQLDEYGVPVSELDESGKPTLGGTGWEEPAGKSDAMQGRPGLPVSVDDSSTAVWEVNNDWEDRDTTAAREAGMDWEADSGLSWEEKFQDWVASMGITDRPGYGDTFMLQTPHGVEVPAPSLECAELTMFLRIAFASWYGLPFFTEATDGNGARLYFGHFGIRTAAGRYGRMANFKTQYTDHSHQADAVISGDAPWPTDANLAGRRIPGSFDDDQPMIGDDVGAGAYFDHVFLNKRVGYFLLMQLTYFGSINLADPVNTYNITPEGLRAGDMLLHRWQPTGIGHVMAVMRADKFGTEANLQMEAQIASGSMPRRQPLWETPAAAKRSFTSYKAGGPDTVTYSGGVKRWRVATEVNGQWTNVVPTFLADEYLPSTAHTRLSERPDRFDELLTELEPEEQLQAMAEVIEQHRAHLRDYPASCAARGRREEAFADLYLLGEELGMTRQDIDEEFRILDDYVFAELVYSESKTCCWNSSTNDMYHLALDLNRQIIEDAGEAACADLVVFQNRDDETDGFEVFRDFATSVGKEDLWVQWSADESCPQADTPEDTEVDHQWTTWCELGVITDDPNEDTGDAVTISTTNQTSSFIPDNDLDGIKSSVEVDSADVVDAVRIDVDITHTWSGDLRLYLIHQGDQVLAYEGSGPEHDVLLSDHNVAGFEGVDASGTWELLVIDTMASDTGQLNEWTLHIDTR